MGRKIIAITEEGEDLEALQVPIRVVPTPVFVAASEAITISPMIAEVSGMQALAAQMADTASDEGIHLLPSEKLPLRLLNLLHKHSLIVFAFLLMAVGLTGIKVGSGYWTQHTLSQVKPAATIATPKVRTIAGLNLTVPAASLQSKLQTIDSQSASLTVGTHVVNVSPDTIRSWLQITSNKNRSLYYLSIRAGTISTSLNKLANQFVKSPVNQVTVTENGVSRVVSAGYNGSALTDANSLTTQADQIAKTVMDSKGMNFNTPLQTVPFQAVTPAAFSKLLVADISTKRMWAFENGQQVNSFLVTAGAPTTPTPIGQFHIYAKYKLQDMKGFNPNGTKYFQPNVPWISYFTAGDAVHGNYWRPASVFGNVNTSHGCLGLPVDQALWVYNWAPIGTTVITHT
ncbi:MAG TPA: L,D-transpeptidase [Candidatus Saccharimonadales bacterium]|nr:L,D-transpeptidase [Candidatus Saccharimonadales bacterium]